MPLHMLICHTFSTPLLSCFVRLPTHACCQDEVLAECGPMRWGAFKPLLADAVVEHLRPLQVRVRAGVEGWRPGNQRSSK